MSIIARSGIGYDSHRFEAGGPLRLGGIDIPSDVHCVGHSDADAVCHAITDALLGAAGLGDIGELFPDTASENAGRDSVEMLIHAYAAVAVAGWAVGNVDVTVITESPKVAPYRAAIRQRLASVLGLHESCVSIKGKTNEGMGWIGRGEGLAVIAVATLTER